MIKEGESRTLPLGALKKRQDFLALRQSRAFRFPAFMIAARKMRESSSSQARFGITVTRKVGGAVERNRIKRRFRSAIREVFPQHAESGVDYVIIAHKKALFCDYNELLDDLKRALLRTAETTK